MRGLQRRPFAPAQVRQCARDHERLSAQAVVRAAWQLGAIESAHRLCATALPGCGLANLDSSFDVSERAIPASRLTLKTENVEPYREVELGLRAQPVRRARAQRRSDVATAMDKHSSGDLQHVLRARVRWLGRRGVLFALGRPAVQHRVA